MSKAYLNLRQIRDALQIREINIDIEKGTVNELRKAGEQLIEWAEMLEYMHKIGQKNDFADLTRTSMAINVIAGL